MAERPGGPWDRYVGAALDAFAAGAGAFSRSAESLIRAAIVFAHIDHAARQVLVDRRALVLGLLTFGAERGNDDGGNTATWLAEWVARAMEIPVAALSERVATAPDEMERAAAGDYPVVFSRSVDRILEIARGYARETSDRGMSHLRSRHVVVAVLAQAKPVWQPIEGLQWSPGQDEIARLCQELFRRIESDRAPVESVEAWRRILLADDPPRLPDAAPAQAAPDAALPPALTLSGFTSDRAAIAFGQRRVGGDPLRIEADVQAFARLICLEEAQPPLSIGLFGGWGSGKSTFMGQLETAIDEIVDAERERRGRAASPQAAPPAESRFVQRVVQIRFNAWHFADASLWASLTAEFFDQLRSGGFARQGQEIHARLVERVNAHVHSLSQTLATTRAALAEGEKQVVDAQKARNDAVDQARRAEGEALSQTLVDAVSGAYERHKADLKEMGRRAYQDDVAKGIDDFVAVAKQVRTIGGQAAAVWKAMTAGQWRRVLLIAAIVLVLTAIVLLPLIDLVAATSLMTQFGIWPALAGLASAAGAVAPAIRIVASIARDTAAIADKLDKVSEQSLKNVVAREAELTAAVNEAQARRDAVDRAARALARYIDPQGAANPPRLLRFVLEDDPDTKAMEKEIGLIGRARRLFQAVDEIVKEERRKRAAGEPSDLDVPDRIVLYIDDLDRCTYAQVYAVLQAIHLLLAFELFVVVVGVDVKWIQDALAAQAGAAHAAEEGRTAAAIELDRRERAIAYLEKIFQLPFWLRPLDTGADGDGSYGAYVQALLAPNLEAPQVSIFKSAVPPLRRALGAGAGEAPPATLGGAGGDAEAPVDAEAATEAAWVESTFALDQALATVRLSRREVDFLASDAIGRIAAKEPRAVKRLVNVYRIVRARMAGEQLLDLLGEGDRAPTYPFVILIAAIETGQPVRVADGFYAALKHMDPETVIDKAVRTPLPAKDEPLDIPEVWHRLGALQMPLEQSPGLAAAIAAACIERDDRGIKVADCLALARKVRRYSFNRYH